jgi:hypothetical protein
VPIPYLWLLAALQSCNLVLLFAHALAPWLPNVWCMFLLVLYEVSDARARVYCSCGVIYICARTDRCLRGLRGRCDLRQRLLSRAHARRGATPRVRTASHQVRTPRTVVSIRYSRDFKIILLQCGRCDRHFSSGCVGIGGGAIHIVASHRSISASTRR